MKTHTPDSSPDRSARAARPADRFGPDGKRAQRLADTHQAGRAGHPAATGAPAPLIDARRRAASPAIATVIAAMAAALFVTTGTPRVYAQEAPYPDAAELAAPPLHSLPHRRPMRWTPIRQTASRA
jgi:hypothetical protein